MSAKWLVLPFGSEVEVAKLSIRAIRIAALGDILAPIELVLYGINRLTCRNNDFRDKIMGVKRVTVG